MTTASPTPFASSTFEGHGRPRLTTSRTLPRAAQSTRPILRRHDPIDNFSQGHGFNADAPMLQSISYGDSSDDDIPVPMNFSALTKAILEDRQPSARERSPPRDLRYSHLRNDSGRSAEARMSSRAGTPSGNVLKISRRSPPPHSDQDNASPPRVVHLSGPRQPAGLRRTASSMEVRQLERSDAEEKVKEYITPAPAPRTRNVRSRAGSTTSGPISSQSNSLANHSGPGSSSQGEQAAISSYENSADRIQPMSDDASSKPISKVGGEALPGSTRVKRLNIGHGTYLKGAPMRRPFRRRQSEDEQSAQEDERGASMMEAEHPISGSDSQRHSRAGSLKPSEARVQAHDFAQDEKAYPRHQRAPTSHDRMADPPVRPSSRQAQDHPTFAPRPDSGLRPKTAEDLPSSQPQFRIPAPPLLPSFNDQENEPPPTFKRNRPLISGILQVREKQEEPRMTHVSTDAARAPSPHRQALAPKSINTPQRAPPPPPKMSVLETATATAGASTIKSKRKRSHVTINGKIFSLKGRLGKGGSSDVYRVMAENDKMFALKKVNLEDCNEDTIRGYKGEIELLKRLENVERVVRLFDYEVNDAKQSLSVLMEIGESDLNRILSTRTHPEDSTLDLAFTRHYWREMLLCVSAVHAHDIVHSDLKPANFLLVQGRLKLIDFGIANKIEDDTVNVHRETNVGTPNYMSPESLQDTNAPPSTLDKSKGPKLMKLGKPSDVWSLGCILYQMTYGRPPFAHIPNQWNRVMAIINPQVSIAYPATGIGGVTVPSSLCTLLSNCLNRDAASRPTVDALLDEREAFLNPDVVLGGWEREGAVPVTEHVLEQILGKIVERCRDPRRGVPSSEEMKVYPKAFLDRVREMRAEGRL